MPAGPNGPAFLLLKNFDVLMSYNPAESYALAIAHLADRIRGGKDVALDAGRVVVLSGKKARVLFTLWGEAAEDRFGWCVSPVEDCNADGTPDLLIGAEGATRGTERPGSVTLVMGAS